MSKPIPFGKYYLLERINVGGMAEVYRAKAYGVEGFERLVAVKRILPNVAEDKEFIKMFVDEAKLAVQLNHANIAQIFDLGMVGSDYYIALEHVHGRDLRATFERCREHGSPMPIAMACFCVMKVCEGLDYAHNKRDGLGNPLGLVHRDVSPQNVLVSFEGEVKLIDFGIAKAAGRGSQTEAGILKGKFGYMSPEQVRGLPIDRRSDVFSCGIVLYEMLTGERLFVGESDFSTLEKVRNVEILPPSTFNRRIPNELERIVLKALAKDVEDRYQNAIDLHDELQAFVYTSGEFYSRKDLAAWMKQTWAVEIEAEKAKLEAFRKFSPQQEAARTPAPQVRPPARGSTPPPVPRRPGGRTLPPPLPPGVGAPGPAAQAPQNLRSTLGGPGTPPTQPLSTPPTKLDWDDDELETAIYDGPEGQSGDISTVKDSPRSLAASGAIDTSPHPVGAVREAGQNDQDLAVLVEKARDWKPEQVEPPAPPLNTATGSGPKVVAPPATLESLSAPSGKLPIGAAPRAARGTDAPPMLPPGAAQGLPMPQAHLPQAHLPQVHPQAHLPHAHGARDSSAVAALAAMAERQRSTFEGPTVDLMDRPWTEGRGGLIAAIGAGVLLLIGGIVAVIMLLGGDEAKVATDTEKAAAVVSPDVLKHTGFDLRVRPEGLKAEIRLDGKSWGPAPLRFRNIEPGEHKVEVVAPEGFFNQVKTVEVEPGKAPTLVVTLDGVPVEVPVKSKPKGALAVLVSEDGERKELGKTPTTAKVDLSKSFEVELALEGYELARKPLSSQGLSIELAEAESEQEAEDAKDADEPAPKRVESSHSSHSSRDDEATAALEKAELARKRARAEKRARDRAEKERAEKERAERAEKARAERAARAAAVEPSGGSGTLLLGSKPPCEIFIDGKNTGKRTPQREISLGEGKHKVVLVNNEHGIRDAFFVKIKTGKRTKVIRNLVDQMK